jgi:nucleoside-diphosphate-sugar epimerase
MRILFTGASSFTGSWFVKALVEQGHSIVAPMRRAQSDYDPLRHARMALIGDAIEIVENCPFGTPQFLALLEREPFDLLCHHGAQVDNYRADDFDVAAAVRANSLNLPTTLKAGQRNPDFAVLLTGSVFEQNEGAGTEPLLAVSPYGLSKGMTSDLFRYWCNRLGVKLAKFVVPNPFGPYEEPRFCDFLMRCWSAGQTAEVKSSEYMRDNIHVSLLAAAYADMVARIDALPAFARLAPSLYAEKQGAFAQRFARQIGSRLKLDCPLDLARQTEFPEPKARINTDKLDTVRLGWHEAEAWDELAAYYRERYLENRVAG